MKSKTNISVVSNTGVRRKSEVIIGDSGTYTSGDILDANATQELINSGGGGGGGDYPSDEQIIHIVADATYDRGNTYIRPTVSESETPETPTYAELLNLINKYKGQVFIDYTVKSKNISEGGIVREYRYILRCTYIDDVDDEVVRFTGIGSNAGHYYVVSVNLDSDNSIWCSELPVYFLGYLHCNVVYNDGYSAKFLYDEEALNDAINHEDIVRCNVYDKTASITHITTLTEMQFAQHVYVFSNSRVELTVEFSGGHLTSTTFKYLRDDPNQGD